MQNYSHLILDLFALPMVIVVAGALLFSARANAERCETFDSHTTKGQRTGLVVGQVTVRTGDLFNLEDPKQGQFVHSAANALHWVTRERTISDALPFRRGDEFNVELLAEGERVLRSKRYLRDASVVAFRVCDERVDIEVRTIDNWTLTPSLSFGSSGGQSRYTFEIQDLNVLGLGKELKLRQRHSGDETASTFVYGDDNVFGSRYRLRLELGDTNEGEQYSLQGGLPFYANDAQRSWWTSIDSATDAFDAPSVTGTRIPVKTEQATIAKAKAIPNSTLPFARVGMGLRFERQVTDLALADTDTDLESTFDFAELYPFVTAQWSRSDWIKRQNYQSIRANEDINLGLSVDLELGLVLAALGNDGDAVRLVIDLTNGWYGGEDALHTLRFQQTHYYSVSDEAKYALSARYQYFRWIGHNNQLDLRLTGETRYGYSPLYDFAVGGDQGLRAYPTEYQSGEQRFLGMAEYRHITAWSPWSLFHAALTSFVEVGRAWSDGEDPDTLADAGIGLLLSPTRSSRAATNRFDISVPLVHGEGVADYQIFVGSTIHF